VATPNWFARAARLPFRYAAAFRMIHRLRRRPRMDDAETLAWGSGLCWYGDRLRITQAPEEILWLLALLRPERPRTVVEIGVDQGGTLFLWTQVAAEDALLVAVDTRRLGVFGSWSPYACVRRAFARRDQRIELLMPADSHDPRTVESVRRILDGQMIDFLFIDGDHSYDGVKRDFELFSPLVRPGGTVALHDVAAADCPGVEQYFAELAGRFECDSRVAAESRRYGIGIVRIPE
jgi:cephalosporin hydroxylase